MPRLRRWDIHRLQRSPSLSPSNTTSTQHLNLNLWHWDWSAAEPPSLSSQPYTMLMLFIGEHQSRSSSRTSDFKEVKKNIRFVFLFSRSLREVRLQLLDERETWVTANERSDKCSYSVKMLKGILADLPNHFNWIHRGWFKAEWKRIVRLLTQVIKCRPYSNFNH